MSSDAVKLAPDARARVDTYLDAIEKALQRAGRARDERRGVADDVEAQILEMLADRAGFAPTVADVEAVLSDLDPPEAYAEADGPPADAAPAGGEGAPTAAARPARPAKPKGPRLSRAAIVGACWAPLAIFLVPALAVLGYRAVAETAPPVPAEAEESVEEGPPQEAPDTPGRAPEPDADAPQQAEPQDGREAVAPVPSEPGALPTLERTGREVEGPSAQEQTTEAAQEAARNEARVAAAEARGRAVDTAAWGPSWVAILILGPLTLLGLTAPFGTTILGLVAIAHIRRSAGRLYGMGLAVFDALLFPLLALDVLLLLLWANLGLPAGILLVLAVDVILVVLAWRLLRPRADGQGGPPSPEAARSRRRLGVVSLVLAVGGLVVGVGVGAVAHVFGLGAAWRVGYPAFFGLEVAALVCGTLAWSATPTAKAGAVAAAALMVASLFMLA